MEYKYGKKEDYQDFSSGRVLYHVKGMTNFPVRLAQEIYGRCLEYSPKKRNIILYDCCCGGGYLLSVLGFLNQDTIGKIMGSDINPDLLKIAEKNLNLLTKEGMEQRIKEIEHLIASFNKESHQEAKLSAFKLKNLLKKDMPWEIFQCDALKGIKLSIKPDIVITDVPYGQKVEWEGHQGDGITKLLDSLYSICHPHTVIALCSNKKVKVRHEKFKRLEKQSVGKRKFEILKIK